jgi:adenylosuccinate synthase
MPATLEELERCKVVYETLDGWDEDISECRSIDSLPEAAQAYIKFIEKELGVPISWVGTGPQREAMFLKE